MDLIVGLICKNNNVTRMFREITLMSVFSVLQKINHILHRKSGSWIHWAIGFYSSFAAQKSQPKKAYLKQRVKLSKFKRFNGHYFSFMQKNVSLLKCFILESYFWLPVTHRLYNRHKDVSGPSLPQAPVGMIHVINDEVSAYGWSPTSSMCYHKIRYPCGREYLPRNLASTPGVWTLKYKAMTTLWNPQLLCYSSTWSGCGGVSSVLHPTVPDKIRKSQSLMESFHFVTPLAR